MTTYCKTCGRPITFVWRRAPRTPHWRHMAKPEQPHAAEPEPR